MSLADRSKAEVIESHRLVEAQNAVNALRIRELTVERNRLREAAAWAYQYVGSHGFEVYALDNLHALSRGEPQRHEWLAITEGCEHIKAERDGYKAALEKTPHASTGAEMIPLREWLDEADKRYRGYPQLEIVLAAIRNEVVGAKPRERQRIEPHLKSPAREREVLKLWNGNVSVRLIAAEMGIKPGTVKVHLKNARMRGK